MYAGDDPVNNSDPSGLDASGDYSTLCELFGAFPYVRVTCLLNPNGPPIPNAGPYSTSDLNRGSIQAQGPDIKVNVRNGQGTLSVAWASHTVPAAEADGRRMINLLKGMLNTTQLKNRSTLFPKAIRYVTQTCPNGQGCTPPGKGFSGQPQQPNSVRVDVKIDAGLAFISSENMPGTTTAYVVPACAPEVSTYAL